MNRIWITAAICLLGLSGNVFAEGEDMGTIFHHEAAPGQFEVWPIFTYKTIDTKLNSNEGNGPFGVPSGKGPASEYKSTAEIETIRGEYGVNDLITVGAELSMGTVNTKLSPDMTPYIVESNSWTYKGMANPVIFANAKMKNMGPGTLFVGVPLSISTGPAKINSDNGGDVKSGGWSVAPWVGYEMAMGPGHLGAHLAYNVFLTDRQIDAHNTDVVASPLHGREQKLNRTGGSSTELDVFYEMPVASMALVGLGVNYGNQSSTFTKNLDSGVGLNDDNGVAGMGVGAYGAIFFSHTIFLAPVLRYDQFSDTSLTTHAKSSSVLTAQAYGVFIF